VADQSHRRFYAISQVSQIAVKPSDGWGVFSKRRVRFYGPGPVVLGLEQIDDVGGCGELAGGEAGALRNVAWSEKSLRKSPRMAIVPSAFLKCGLSLDNFAGKS